jgi:hypothetical protein
MVLKALALDIKEGIAYTINRAFVSNILPFKYKESFIITLYKEKKKDYSFFF